MEILKKLRNIIHYRWFGYLFAVGVAADFIKSGAPARGERVAKYNRLAAIEVELSQHK